MEELKEIENQEANIQGDFAAAIASRRSNRNDHDAERAERSMQHRLTEVVTKAFEIRQQVQRLQVYRLQSRLIDVTQKMNQREELRKRIISQRINQMTQEAERIAAKRLDALRSGARGNSENDDSPRADGDTDFPGSDEDLAGDSGKDALTAVTVRVTWNFTEDFGRRTKQIHTSGTIVGEGADGATLVVTAIPELPDDEPSSVIANWPGTNPHRAQIVAADRKVGLLLLSTALASRRTLPFDTSPKAGLSIRATWVTDDGWADKAGVIAATARLAGERRMIQHDISAPGEAAGGPIVNRKGHIVGLLASPAAVHGINVAIPADLVEAFLKPAMSSQQRPRNIESEGADLTQRTPDRNATADTQVELLEIRRDLVDAEHAFLAAEKQLTQMQQLNQQSARIVPVAEVERAKLSFDRTQDMLRATQEIRDTRVKLLEQKIQQTESPLNKKMAALQKASERLEKDPDDPVQKAYCEDLREGISQ